MKIAIECKSLLLQKSLELFLEEHLTSVKYCDICICDVECFEDDERCFYISQDANANANLIKPFPKSQLILALESRYKKIKKDTSDNGDKLDFSILEKRIDSLTQEYKENIIKAVRAFYER